jgi:hypothetical protein
MGFGFSFPVDIANRACQHCGVPRIDTTLGFLEDSQRAEEISAVYDKLRRAELRNNTWRFATRTAVLRAIDLNTLLLTPALWTSAATYFAGSIVVDQTGYIWQSRIANNLNNQPETTPAAWEAYFGPLTVMKYDSTQSYLSGELVYTAPGDGTNRVYLSLQSANSDNPATATAWDGTVTYQKNQVVTRVSTAYMSLIDLNFNQDPSTTFVAPWAVGTTYAAAAKATGSDGIVYQSIGSGNLGHDPTTDNGVHWTNTGVLSPWSTSFVGGTGSLKWLQIGGAEFPAGVVLTDLNVIWPIGSGPSTQEATRNVYRLPAGYLRRAPQDPSAGSISYLGYPGNPQAVDWNFTGNYIVSSQTDPIIFRFIADVTDVSLFDDMFCESLGARIGEAVVQPLTQSTAKLADIRTTYRYYMAEAKRTQGIELGPVEPELDDYIACRA